MSPAFGVYPVADALTEGEQISSTYEGRHITLFASEIRHAGAVVTKGRPVVFGTVGLHGVGIAFNTEVLGTDLIAIDTEGIWVVDVHAEDDGGVGSAVVGGDLLFINTTTCVVSKITNIATQIPFGYALGAITASLTERIAVKVHFDPTVDSHVAQFNTVLSGAYGKSMRTTMAGGASEGLSGYHEGHLTANTSGHLYNFGSWINVDAQNILKAGHIITPYEGGVWAGTTQTEARVVFAGQHQAILAGVPASMHAWRLNVAQVAGPITALIAAANPESVGYAAGVGVGTAIGWIKIADIVGVGVVYAKVYSAM